METITKQYQVYKFSELSEDAQDKVIENLYDINVDGSYWYECAVDDLHEDLKDEYGIEFKNVYFDIGRPQVVYLDKPYVSDERRFLKKAGCDLRTKESREILESGISIETHHRGGGDASNYCTSSYNDVDALTECLRDKLAEFLARLGREYDYYTSREAIIETIEANEYTFLENGKMFNV